LIAGLLSQRGEDSLHDVTKSEGVVLMGSVELRTVAVISEEVLCCSGGGARGGQAHGVVAHLLVRHLLPDLNVFCWEGPVGRLPFTRVLS